MRGLLHGQRNSLGRGRIRSRLKTTRRWHARWRLRSETTWAPRPAAVVLLLAGKIGAGALRRWRRYISLTHAAAAGGATPAAPASGALGREAAVSVATGSGASPGCRQPDGQHREQVTPLRCQVRLRSVSRTPRSLRKRATAALALAGVTILRLTRTRPQPRLHRAMTPVRRQLPLLRRCSD